MITQLSDFQILLIILVLSALLGPIYIFLRVRIQKTAVDQDKEISFYRLRRAMKLVLVHGSLMLGVILSLIWLWLRIKSYNEGLGVWTEAELALALLIVLALGFIAYGSGMYISSIVSEEFTINKLKRVREYNILYMIMELFHGPLSHVLIFFGTVLVLYLIALVEVLGDPRSLDGAPYALLGIVSGIVFGLSQIFNNTWKHQTPPMLGLTIGYYWLASSLGFTLSQLPFNTYFAYFSVATSSTLSLKFILYKLRHGNYRYQGFGL